MSSDPTKMKRATAVISKVLEEEKQYKLNELAQINHRLKLTEEYLDRLRAYTLGCFYTDERERAFVTLPKQYPIMESESSLQKRRIIIGNLSKYITADQRANSNDQFTYKWLLYVRSPPGDDAIETFVSKVIIKLDPSYRPNDEIELTEPPFEARRRGWGEFPVKVKIFFGAEDQCIEVNHQLALDTAFSGLQTPGAETIVDVEFSPNSEEKPRKQVLTSSSKRKKYAGPSSLS